MSTNDKDGRVVSELFCLPYQQVLTIRRRPNVVMGGGFVVTDYHQKQILFMVDGCGILGERDQLLLKDGRGDALLLIRRKEGVVEALSLHRRWIGYRAQYEVSQELIFTLKDPKLRLARSNAIRISAQLKTRNCSRDFAVRGDFSKKDCSIVDGRGNIIAQIWMHHESGIWRPSNDFYHVTVNPGVDQAFVIGVIAVLDYMYGESTSCTLI